MMTPEQFCYWLQGRAELVPTPPSEEEWKSIVKNLELVFNKVTKPTPSYPPWTPNIYPGDWNPSPINC